ncbi:MAG: GtrA family protein [Erysipelotrichaceae bacterium]|nr:GtrA family protein [Erysipelotrichaceae bacterium]
MKDLRQQILRFGVVGGTAFLIDYAFLYIFTEFFGMHYLVSAVLSFSLSSIFNYIASVLWVFHVDESKSKSKTFIIFIFFSIIGLCINELIMYIGVDVLSMHYMFVKIGATAIVMVFNFITRKLFLE